MEALRFAAALLLVWSPSARAASGGILLTPHGKSVEVAPAGGEDWRAASGALSLAAGQRVRTGAYSTAEITFSDGSKVILSPSAQFTVERADARETLFNLELGKLKAYFSGVFSSRMNIRTPTAVCSVRGTVFDISVGQHGTDMDVHEGHMEVNDGKGHQAVITAEETVRIGQGGMEKPHLVGLGDSRAQGAVRPMAVRATIARDRTRAMVEELRNRELKANEAQLGKDAIDAFGNRVRIEEYLLRPAPNEFKILFLSLRKDSFNWGSLDEVFAKTIPNDMSQVPAIVSASFFSPTPPKNWIKYFEVFLTNTVDSIKESVTFGDPTQINFNGFVAGIGNLYYPSSIYYQQVLSGPGVPGGSRTQFQLVQDYGLTLPGQFTVRQDVVDVFGNLSTLTLYSLDPSNALNVAAGGTALLDRTCASGYAQCANIDPVTTTSYPNGIGKADFFTSTSYRDGSTLGAEKFLVSDQGKILDFSQPTSGSFTQLGSYNLEEVVTSNLFQGRKIDVLFSPEILSQKQNGTTSATGGIKP